MRKAYQCEHTVPPVWWFTFTDRNALGEEIAVEFHKNENTHGKHSLPTMWKRKGFIDKEPETWWGVQTYVTDLQGRCSGKYNPTTKDGKLNFEWLLEATEENQQKIIDEIYRRANAIWYRENWHLEDLEEAIRSAGLEVTQERVDKLLEECHRIFDDKSERNELLAQKASELFEEE